MIYLRIDDYPSGSELCQIPDDYPAPLAGLKAALGGAPFCLAVVLGFLPPDEIEALALDPQIYIAAHGMTHSQHECESEPAVREMVRLLPTAGLKRLVPPKNIIRNYALLAQHFDLILTGPYQAEHKDWPKARWPAFYGRARDLTCLEQKPTAGIIALHLTWEAAEDFSSVRRLRAQGYWEQVATWEANP